MRRGTRLPVSGYSRRIRAHTQSYGERASSVFRFTSEAKRRRRDRVSSRSSNEIDRAFVEGSAKVLIWSFDRLFPSHSRGAEGVESVERNRDSRLLIALYSSWPMPASKAIRFPPPSSAKLFRFHGPRSFLSCEETSSSTAFNFASEFSFSFSREVSRPEQAETYD